MTAVRREKLAAAWSAARADANAGLRLRRGLRIAESGSSDSSAEHTAKQALVNDLAELKAPEVYRLAFERWQRSLRALPERFALVERALLTRLYIGVTRDNPLEAGLSVHHVYGMPLIPGSAIKGVMRSVAWQRAMKTSAINYLFGAEQKSKLAEAGAIIVHDAWWIPEGKPFVAEVVTPHHQDYYHGKAPATDFDSPIPAPQLAAQGSFLFVIECLEAEWRAVAMKLLDIALREHGLGSKTTSGYGLFRI